MSWAVDDFVWAESEIRRELAANRAATGGKSGRNNNAATISDRGIISISRGEPFTAGN